MALRTKTIEYAFDTNMVALAAAARHDFAAVTLHIPEATSRTFQNVFIEINVRGTETTGTSITSWLMGIKLGAVAFSDTTVTSTVTNSGDQQSHRFTSNVTSYFNTNFGAGTSETAQVGVQFGGLGVINVTAKLIITYVFDDAAQTTRVKTVKIPIESPTSTLTATLAEIGTNQVPILTGGSGILPENTITIRDLFFEIMANETHISGTTDDQLGVSLDAEAEVLFGSLEQALDSSPYMTVIWKRTDMDTTAAHAFKARGTTTGRLTNICAVLVVTYTYNHDNSTSIFNSMEIAIPSEYGGFGGVTSTDASSGTFKFFIEEPTTLTLQQSGIFLCYTASNVATIAGLNIKVGGQTFRTYSPITNPNGPAGQYSLMHRFDTNGAAGSGLTIARGENTITFELYKTSGATHAYGAGWTIMAYLNYTSGKAAGGDGTHNHTTKWLVGATASVGTAGIYEFATMAPVISETAYWNIAEGYSLYFMFDGRGWCALTAEVLSGELKGNGWQDLFVGVKNQANELEYITCALDASPFFNRHPDDPSPVMQIDTSRKYRVTIPQNNGAASLGLVSLVLNFTYHSITFPVTKNVSGYDGDGSGIVVHIYRNDTKERLFSVTTVAGGDYSFTAYDDTVALFAEAREDATHVGRSNNFTPT